MLHVLCGWALQDSVFHFKNSAVRVVYDLLLAKPEQEAALLALLVRFPLAESPRFTRLR